MTKPKTALDCHRVLATVAAGCTVADFMYACSCGCGVRAGVGHIINPPYRTFFRLIDTGNTGVTIGLPKACTEP